MLSMEKRDKSESQEEKELAAWFNRYQGEQERAKDRRWEIIIAMDRNIALARVGYYILFALVLSVTIMIISENYAVSFFEGLVMFVAGLWAARYLWRNKIFVHIYNKHVEKTHEKKEGA